MPIFMLEIAFVTNKCQLNLEFNKNVALVDFDSENFR